MLFATFLGLYFLAGMVIAIFFLAVGYRLILPDAAGTKFSVRMLWAPAVIMIWPLVLLKLFNRAPAS